ncbi:MAG: hypothetical protein AAF383_06715 [Cyanobacteria bacterium P01_A01_bin.83]
MTNQSKLESLSFPQAIAATQSLMDQIDANELSEAEVQQAVSSILSTKNGGRGFFVSYLTSNLSLADNPSLGIIKGLSSAIELSSELLVKNLAMSYAMSISHNRHNDHESEKDSLKVYHRTSNLIHKINSDLIWQELQKLQSTLMGESKKYQSFLERWNYDAEQKRAIEKAVCTMINSRI